MKILYFGIYNPNYSRNRILISGLRANGVKVLECNSRAKGIKKYFELYKNHKKFKNQYDAVIVGFSGHSIIWFAKLITNKKIIFDAFVSQYLSNIIDRKISSKNSFKALYYWLLDKYSCKFANLVLLDTNAQIDYFVKTFNLPKSKFTRIFVGSDLAKFSPNKTRQDQYFNVHWHGYIVPFDGIETILSAVSLLKQEAIKFRIITRLNSEGKKLQARILEKNLSNVEILLEVAPGELAMHIDEASICLGVFGENQKARVVIPNKIYECIARGKVVITARHQVILELLEDGKNVITVNPNDPKDLAEKILALKQDYNYAQTVGQNAHTLFMENLTPKVLAKQLLGVVEPA